MYLGKFRTFLLFSLYNKSDVQDHSLSYSLMCKLIIHEKVSCALFYFSKSCKVVLKNLRSVKSNPYPSYCFLATKKVMDIVSEFIVNHNMKCDRTVDDSWEDFEKLVVNAESKPDTIVTRNLRVVKRAVSEGYGNMLKRTCVDQHKKKAFVFYANDRIAEIKAEEDAKSQERYEQRPKTDITPVDMKEKKKNIDTEMSKLIKKAMEEQK